MNSNGKGFKIVFTIFLIIVMGLTAFVVIYNENKMKVPEGSLVLKGSADGFKGPINATVTLTGDKITDLFVVGLDETPEIGGLAIDALTEAILANGATSGVDVITGATYTSNGVLEAVDNAIKNSK